MRILQGILPALLALALAVSAAAVVAEGGAPPPPEPTSGTVTGILVARGDNWIQVKAEGAREAVRYLPPWRGGLPSEGGGPDKTIVDAIKKLVVSNLVQLTWEKQENSRRVTSVTMLAIDPKSGTVTGTLVAKGEVWIDVKPKDGPTERYMAKWVPGPPNAEGKPTAGGMDPAMVKIIAGLKIGSTVEVKWSSDERKRIDGITVTAEPPPPAAPATTEGVKPK